MAAYLKKIGISAEVLAFFHAHDLHFDYGHDQEVFAPGFHYVPTTTHVWLAGNQDAPEVIITLSAMEALAWYATNQNRYRDPAALAFISLGNLPSEKQLGWLLREFPKRKFSLVLGNHLLGCLADIKVALSIAGKPVALRWQKEKVGVGLDDRTVYLDAAECSLNRLEKITGIRTGVRTRKPKQAATFLHKLQQNVV